MLTTFARLAIAATAAAALFAPGAATAQASEDAAQLYQNVADVLKQHDRFAVDLTLEYTISVGDQSESLTTTYATAFERPDAVTIKVRNPNLQADFYLKGAELIQYLPETDQYALETVEMKPAVLVSRAGVGPIPDAMVIFMEFFLENPFEVPLEHAVKSEVRGEDTIDGEPHDVVYLEMAKMAWTAWITQGDQPVIRRIVPKLTSVEEFFADQTQSHVELQVVMDLENWTFDPEAVGEKLAFAQADTAERVEDFAQAAAGDPKKLLVGKPAPAFVLSALDGSTFNLADKVGKEIVVLDFWATWCGPCRRGMPIMDRVTREFNDQDVYLYTVNLQEDKASIQTFLNQVQLDVPVLMDTDGAVQAAYYAHTIPQTVIIGKDGIVEAVHIGVTPNLEEELRAQLRTLADGGSLLSE